METSTVLAIVKARLGISVTVRDTYLTDIINGVIRELEKIQGLAISATDNSHLMFIADYSEYRYSNKDNPIMPRHLQWRLHNLMISNKPIIVANILLVDVLPDVPVVNTVYLLADGTKQMYIDGAWTTVAITDGVWAVV